MQSKKRTVIFLWRLHFTGFFFTKIGVFKLITSKRMSDFLETSLKLNHQHPRTPQINRYNHGSFLFSLLSSMNVDYCCCLKTKIGEKHSFWHKVCIILNTVEKTLYCGQRKMYPSIICASKTVFSLTTNVFSVIKITSISWTLLNVNTLVFSNYQSQKKCKYFLSSKIQKMI